MASRHVKGWVRLKSFLSKTQSVNEHINMAWSIYRQWTVVINDPIWIQLLKGLSYLFLLYRKKFKSFISTKINVVNELNVYCTKTDRVRFNHILTSWYKKILKKKIPLWMGLTNPNWIHSIYRPNGKTFLKTRMHDSAKNFFLSSHEIHSTRYNNITYWS